MAKNTVIAFFVLTNTTADVVLKLENHIFITFRLFKQFFFSIFRLVDSLATKFWLIYKFKWMNITKKIILFQLSTKY